MKIVMVLTFVLFGAYSIYSSLNLQGELAAGAKVEEDPFVELNLTKAEKKNLQSSLLPIFGLEEEPKKELVVEKQKVDPNIPPKVELLGLVTSEKILKAVMRVTPADPEQKPFILRLQENETKETFTLKKVKSFKQNVELAVNVNGKVHDFNLQLFTRKKIKNED